MLLTASRNSEGASGRWQVLTLYNVWMFVIEHGHGAFMEFIVDLGDHYMTHLFAVVVFNGGVMHVGCKVVRRIRKRKMK